MLWFAHPVNEAREAGGRPTINTLWLSGNGELRSAAPRYAAVDSTLPLLAAIEIDPSAPRALETFDRLVEPARADDWSGWRAELDALDRRLGELMDAQSAKRVGTVTMVLCGADATRSCRSRPATARSSGAAGAAGARRRRCSRPRPHEDRAAPRRRRRARRAGRGRRRAVLRAALRGARRDASARARRRPVAAAAAVAAARRRPPPPGCSPTRSPRVAASASSPTTTATARRLARSGCAASGCSGATDVDYLVPNRFDVRLRPHAEDRRDGARDEARRDHRHGRQRHRERRRRRRGERARHRRRRHRSSSARRRVCRPPPASSTRTSRAARSRASTWPASA